MHLGAYTAQCCTSYCLTITIPYSYSQAVRGDQKRHWPVQQAYLFDVFQIITFQVDHSFCRNANNLRKSCSRKKTNEEQRQLLMFGSRNRCTKSRKERNYAPPLANSWPRQACHTLYLLISCGQVQYLQIYTQGIVKSAVRGSGQEHDPKQSCSTRPLTKFEGGLRLLSSHAYTSRKTTHATKGTQEINKITIQIVCC